MRQPVIQKEQVKAFLEKYKGKTVRTSQFADHCQVNNLKALQCMNTLYCEDKVDKITNKGVWLVKS